MSNLQKVYERSFARLLNLFMNDRNCDYQKSVLVAGSGRSGTTWLAELINHLNEYRIIFEPFNGKRIPASRHFRRRQYLDPNLPNIEHRVFVEKVLTGQFRHWWSDMFNRRVFVEKRIIKVIRANFFLRWLKNSFPSLRIVYIIRHPFMVALSKSSLGFSPPGIIQDIFEQKAILDFLKVDIPQNDVREMPPFLQQVFVWCVENATVLNSFEPEEYCVVCYEELKSASEKVFEAIAESIDSPGFSNRIYSFNRPSKSAKTATKTEDEKFAGIPKEEKKLAIEMLSMFQLNSFYGENPGSLLTSSEMNFAKAITNGC